MSLSSPHKFGKLCIDREQQHHKQPLYQEEEFSLAEPSTEHKARSAYPGTLSSTYAEDRASTEGVKQTGYGHFKDQARKLQYT